jgi:integrase/recombinase XerC
MLRQHRADTPLDARNRAILELLFNPALRRAEVCNLDLSDLEISRSTLWVRGKGRAEDELLELPPPALAAIEAWLKHRGDEPGPLFLSLDRGAARRCDGTMESRRLRPVGLYKMVGVTGREARVGPVHPHGLRHSGITTAAEATGGDMVAVSQFARHRCMNVTKKYIDNLEGVQGRVSRRLAAFRRKPAASASEESDENRKTMAGPAV